jgi:hypothetical protein
MRPQGVWPSLILRRFELACRRLGYTRVPPALDCSRFRRPSAGNQLELL